jgi:XTP/dITP diphosphohydrolase
MRIVVATNNPGKLDELRRLLPEHVTLLTLDDVGCVSPEETGHTFVENSLIKARSAAASGYPAIADDSGLEVEALSGAPGVRSARFAGPQASDDENNRLLIEMMAALPSSRRGARFVSAVALVTPDGQEHTSVGELSGMIVSSPRGSGGFGYDPLFMIDDARAGEYNGRTLAELSRSEKNVVSHRSRAYRAIRKQLEEVLHAHGNAGAEG